ncbi:MAG: class I SAM-dependent methyltransferase [Myxococcaceae bacterium]
MSQVPVPEEGYATLERMDGAQNYNAWLGRRIRPYLGARVLEVGAGIGTITEQIQQDRELVIALEVEQGYVDRLKERFKDAPHVRPHLSGVELVDWKALRKEHVDSVVLSNVLEHIEDDDAAVRNFRHVLEPGGKLVLFVPALQQLYGTMDESVGHHRRYTQDSLRRVLESNGFEVERIEWMNLLGIPAWFLNSRIFKRRVMPPLQLKVYNLLAPLIAQAESRLRLPIGLSLFAVATAREET